MGVPAFFNGNWSFKTSDERPCPEQKKLNDANNEVTSSEQEMNNTEKGKNGCVVRTLPHTLRFAPNHKYSISFEYKLEKDDQ